jgi:hypothetical protein
LIDLKIFNLSNQHNNYLAKKPVNNHGFIEWKLEDKAKLITRLIDG